MTVAARVSSATQVHLGCPQLSIVVGGRLSLQLSSTVVHVHVIGLQSDTAVGQVPLLLLRLGRLRWLELRGRQREGSGSDRLRLVQLRVGCALSGGPWRSGRRGRVEVVAVVDHEGGRRS